MTRSISKRPRLAIVGAGFAGMACCHHLQPHAEITLIDPAGIGGGASGAAAGLLHPSTGKRGTITPKTRAAFEEALSLVNLSEAQLQMPFTTRKGVLRLASNEEQEAYFRFVAQEASDAVWQPHPLPGLGKWGGLFMEKGIALDGKAYLEGLARTCAFTLETRVVKDLDMLRKSFDGVVLTVGIHTKKLWNLPLHGVKGQMVRLAWPKGFPPLPFPIAGSPYALMAQDNTSVWIGATYEHDFLGEQPDPDQAKAWLLPKAAALFPHLHDAAVLEVRAGIRASTPNRQPISQRLDHKLWTLCGLGSKGLLLHAHLARQLCDLIVSDIS